MRRPEGAAELGEHHLTDGHGAACIIHLIRGSFRYASRKYWDELSRGLKPIYQGVNADAAADALEGLEQKWGQRYPAMIRLWRNAWAEFIPFLDYDLEIRAVICSTNAIESLNARYRRAVKARGHFPTEQAAMKRLYWRSGPSARASSSEKTAGRLRPRVRTETWGVWSRLGRGPEVVPSAPSSNRRRTSHIQGRTADESGNVASKCRSRTGDFDDC